MQTNFVLGLDSDEGAEPFELTKHFIDRTPGPFPGYSLLSAFGQAAPLNLEYQKAGRVLPFPFHFLNNNHAMNVRPANYSWPEFYDGVDRRHQPHVLVGCDPQAPAGANRGALPRVMNVVRAISSEGFGRMRYYREIRRLLDADTGFRRYFEQETDVLPPFYVERVKKDLGSLWEWLPEGALAHDPLAYLKDQPVAVPAAAALAAGR